MPHYVEQLFVFSIPEVPSMKDPRQVFDTCCVNCIYQRSKISFSLAIIENLIRYLCPFTQVAPIQNPVESRHFDPLISGATPHVSFLVFLKQMIYQYIQ